MNTIKSGKWLLSMLVPALLVGCQSSQRMADADLTARELPQLTPAYLAAAKPRQDPHPSTRLPIRRAQKRNLKVLANQCKALLKDVEAWDSDARLTSVDADQRDEVRATVRAFRGSLRDLAEAATASNRSGVRAQYAATMTSYRQLVTLTGAGTF